MRKSIFLTAIAMLWVAFAFGQTDDAGATPTKPTDCSENANFPAAGVPHAYEVAVTNAAGYTGAGTYTWYVTKDASNLLTGTKETSGADKYFTATPKSGDLSDYNSVVKDDTKNKIELTWHPKSIIDAGPYFLVLNYKETNTSGGDCAINNVKVMKIEPLNKFQLEMVAYDKENSADFTDGNGVNCAADVDGATYADEKVTYTYGKQTLYYKVTAKGFKGKWLPKFQLPALKGKQTYESAKIYTDMGATTAGPALNTLNTTAEGAAATQKLTGAGTLDITDAEGTTYLLEVVIKNNTYQTLEAQELTEQTTAVAVDGTYGGTDNSSLQDLTNTCQPEGDFADFGKYTIKNRPEIKATSGGFIQRVE